MGANQSNSSGQVNLETQDEHRIVVVNSASTREQTAQEIVLPSRVAPVLSVEGYIIDSNRHKPEVQVDHTLWLDFVAALNEFTNSRADLISSRQNKLQEKVVALDEHVEKFTDSYVNETHKALATMNDDCRKVEEINKLLHKCTIQSELCLGMLNKMNFLLPQEHKLEALEP